LVSKESTHTTETFNKLVTFLRFVSNKFNLSSIILIVVAEPFREGIF
jgi:hypothetical protein